MPSTDVLSTFDQDSIVVDPKSRPRRVSCGSVSHGSYINSLKILPVDVLANETRNDQSLKHHNWSNRPSFILTISFPIPTVQRWLWVVRTRIHSWLWASGWYPVACAKHKNTLVVRRITALKLKTSSCFLCYYSEVLVPLAWAIQLTIWDITLKV